MSQLSANDCKTIWALVTYNGGSLRLSLDLNKTTHLVIAKPSGVSFTKNKFKLNVVHYFANI